MSSTDVKLTASANGGFDLSIVDGDIEGTPGFDTAIWVSLFSDARATASQVVIPEYRRGWPGNLVSTVNGRDLGGLLWLVDQRRLNQKTLNEAVDYTRGALNWFLEDGIAQNVEVDGEIVPASGIQLNVTITSFNGDTETHYVKLWEVTGAD